MSKAKTIIDDLADSALMARFAFDGVYSKDVPGSIIERLSPEKRAELQKLTSAELENVRWPRPEGMNLEKMPRRIR